MGWGQLLSTLYMDYDLDQQRNWNEDRTMTIHNIGLYSLTSTGKFGHNTQHRYKIEYIE